jgi:hypothetical protein
MNRRGRVCAGGHRMRFEYVLQHRDQAEALQAWFPGGPEPAGASPAPRRWVAAVVLAAGILLLLQIGPAVAAAASGYCPGAVTDAAGDGRLFHAGAVSAGAGLLLCTATVLVLLRMKKSDRPINPSPVDVAISDDGVTLRTETKDFALTWDGVVAFAETENLFVLKTMGDLRLALPKRALASPDGVAQLRETLRARVAPLGAVVTADHGVMP